MPNQYFRFKQFTVQQDQTAMKVTTDGCLFGAWVAEEIRTRNTNGDLKVLDIGTGTGLLSLMVAQKNQLQLDAIELDPLAAQQAKENAANSPWHQRIHVMQADVLQYQPSEPYDVIITNPPFYENEWASPQALRNMAHHDSGLLLTELFQRIPEWLKNDGKFFVLLPSKREKEVENLTGNAGLRICKKIQVRPSAHHSPTRIMLACSVKEKEQEEKPEEVMLTDISIRNTTNEYTDEFIALLKDYYLAM